MEFTFPMAPVNFSFTKLEVYLLCFCSHKKSYICHTVGLDTIKPYDILCNTGIGIVSFAWSDDLNYEDQGPVALSFLM